MARIIVIDNDGNTRMDRDTNNTILPPPPGYDEPKWAALVVESLLRQLEKE